MILFSPRAPSVHTVVNTYLWNAVHKVSAMSSLLMFPWLKLVVLFRLRFNVGVDCVRVQMTAFISGPLVWFMNQLIQLIFNIPSKHFVFFSPESFPFIAIVFNCTQRNPLPLLYSSRTWTIYSFILYLAPRHLKIQLGNREHRVTLEPLTEQHTGFNACCFLDQVCAYSWY